MFESTNCGCFAAFGGPAVLIGGDKWPLRFSPLSGLGYGFAR